MNDLMTFEEAEALARNKDPHDHCRAIFYTASVEDPEETEKTGKVHFKEVPFVRILIPGNNKEVFDQPALKKHIERFPKEWYAYQNKKEPELEGFPIDQWAQITKAQADTLKANNILTVEALAETSDQNLSTFSFGMQTLKQKAVTFLEMQDGEANVQKLATKNRKLERDVKRLEKELAGLRDILAKKEEDSTSELPA